MVRRIATYTIAALLTLAAVAGFLFTETVERK